MAQSSSSATDYRSKPHHVLNRKIREILDAKRVKPLPPKPRTSEAGPLGLDVEGLYRADDFFVEVRGAIEDQITRRRAEMLLAIAAYLRTSEKAPL